MEGALEVEVFLNGVKKVTVAAKLEKLHWSQDAAFEKRVERMLRCRIHHLGESLTSGDFKRKNLRRGEPDGGWE